ncbi:MAG: hypothetical protein V4581_06205 [Bacteroidota bacterium]
MKNVAIIKNSVFVALTLTGMNMISSCESCSRKDNEHDDVTVTHDTVYIDTCMTPNDTIREGATGVYIPRGQKPAATATGTGTPNGGKASSTPKKALTQEEIDNRVENSSSQAYKDGKPVNSGGTSGSGQGTGTGSTGNNSRVTSKKDQLKN